MTFKLNSNCLSNDKLEISVDRWVVVPWLSCDTNDLLVVGQHNLFNPAVKRSDLEKRHSCKFGIEE